METYLYHGSPHILDSVCPRPSGVADDSRHLVFATHLPWRAIPFCFCLRGDSGYEWKVEYDHFDFRVLLRTGSIDFDKNGFIYVLPTAGFVRINDWEWVNCNPVEPLCKFEIEVKKYKDKVVSVPVS